MKRYITKIVSLALALATIASLSACGGNSKDSSKKYNAEGKQIITVGIQPRAAVSDYENNEMTLWFEEKLDIDIQFVDFPLGAQDWRAKWTAMAAANEQLPDIMWGCGWGVEERANWGSEGYLLDLTPYMTSEAAAEYRARWDGFFGEGKYDEMLKNIASPDGGIYGFPNGDVYLSRFNSNTHTFINKVWLDNLGLEIPTTYEEFVAVLRAFKEQDANGNGDPNDEIPAVGQVGANTASGTLAGNLPAWILNNWEFVDDFRQFNVDENGKLYSPYTTEAYREGLKALYDLVNEGLLSDQTWTTTMGTAEMTMLWTPDSEYAISGVISGAIGARVTKDSPLALQYVPLPPFNYAPMDVALDVPACQIFVTTDCTDPDKVFEMLMLLGSEEGANQCRRGTEGKWWQFVDDPTSASGQGVQVLERYENPHNVHWGVYSGVLCLNSKDTRHHELRDNSPERAWDNAISDVMVEHDVYYKEKAVANNPKVLVNHLSYTAEEGKDVGEVQPDLLSFVKDARAKFATGSDGYNPHNDADWQKYLETLEAKGWSTWMKHAEAAWNRAQQG